MTTAQEMFGGELSPKQLAKKTEALDTALKSAVASPNFDPMFKDKIEAGLPQAFAKSSTVTSRIADLVSEKSLSSDEVASLNNILASRTGATADIGKDISLTSPLSSSFAAFDLEAPAKWMVPVPTPLRNKLPRTKGVGTAHRIKKINGFSNAITGGLAKIHPGITETTQNNFAVNGSAQPLYLNRGPKISYSATDAIFAYSSFGLSDDVTFDAQYSGLGYQDLVATSARALLYSSMLAEENMLLFGRGTAANGFQGALTVPTITLTKRAAAAGETPLTDATYYVYTTASAGAFGESVASTVVSTTTSTQVIDVVVSASVAGAVGYKTYAGTTTGNANAHYAGTSATTTFTLQGANYATTGATAPTADTTAFTAGYDGILSYVLGAQSGYNNNINAAFSTSNPGVEFQTAFAAMYAQNLANPDEIFMNGSDRKQLSDAIKSAGSQSAYRLNLTQTETGSYVGGATIDALHNEVTGKLVNLTVHPYLTQGVAPILSYTLPFENSEVSNLWAAVNVQDYTYLNWPKIQLQNEASTYWRGTFVSYGPQWSGAVSGIKAA